MCAVEFVKQTTRITQWRLTVRALAPEDGVVGMAIGTGEISVCCYRTGTEGLGKIQVAWLAGLFRPDDPSFSFRFSEVAVGFVVQTTCVAKVNNVHFEEERYQ